MKTNPTTNPQIPTSLDELIASKRAEFMAAGFSEEEIRAALELLLDALADETNADARGVLGAQVQS